MSNASKRERFDDAETLDDAESNGFLDDGIEDAGDAAVIHMSGDQALLTAYFPRMNHPSLTLSRDIDVRVKSIIEYTAKKMKEDAHHDELSTAFTDYVKGLDVADIVNMAFECLERHTRELLGSSEWTITHLKGMATLHRDLAASGIYGLVGITSLYVGSTRNFKYRNEQHMENCQLAIDGDEECESKQFYDAIAQDGILPDVVYFAINRFNAQPLWLEVLEDLLIRILGTFNPTRRLMSRQRSIANASRHPKAPMPNWKGQNAALPCCSGSAVSRTSDEVCFVCDEHFTDTYSWKHHLAHQHRIFKPYSCTKPNCEVRGYIPSDIFWHERNVHTFAECEICGKVYPLSGIKAHTQICQGKDYRPYTTCDYTTCDYTTCDYTTCEICGGVYLLSSMKAHTQTHHKGNHHETRTRVNCDICGKSIFPSSLKNHKTSRSCRDAAKAAHMVQQEKDERRPALQLPKATMPARTSPASPLPPPTSKPPSTTDKNLYVYNVQF
jgi:hypothetical protein